LDGLGRTREPDLAGCDDAERYDHRLVVVEHERRQPVARPDAVAAADAALSFDRDPELLQRRDVAPDGAPIDLQPLGDLGPRRNRLGLQQLEQLEQSGGRCHGS
jgi:hypothetical protein